MTYDRVALLQAFASDKPCGDCGADIGAEHTENCDVARCLVTGEQRLGCGEQHDCGRDVHTRWWPGARECAEWGWFMKINGRFEPALNEIPRRAEWNAAKRQWERRPGEACGTEHVEHEWAIRAKAGVVVVNARDGDPTIRIATVRGSVDVPREAVTQLIDALTDVTKPYGTPSAAEVVRALSGAVRLSSMTGL